MKRTIGFALASGWLFWSQDVRRVAASGRSIRLEVKDRLRRRGKQMKQRSAPASETSTGG